MKTVARNLYTITELKEQFPATYKKVIEENRHRETDGIEWYEYVYDDTKTLLAFCGFSDIDIRFSGFWSQGDGASFAGKFNSSSIDISALKEYAPNDVNFTRLAEFLKEKCTPYGNVTFNLERTQYVHYVHANTITLESMECEPENETAWDNLRGDFIMQTRSIMSVIYSTLEEEYNALTTDDTVEEALDANDMYFDEYGVSE